MGIHHYGLICGFGQCDPSEKEASDILQRVPTTYIPLHIRHKDRARRRKMEHQGPSHDFTIDKSSILWGLLANHPRSPVFSCFLKGTHLTHLSPMIPCEVSSSMLKREASLHFFGPLNPPCNESPGELFNIFTINECNL
jgi:hypothetical protein